MFCKLTKYILVLICLCCVRFVTAELSAEEAEEFHEELFVKPLSSGHVNTYFQFSTSWHYGEQSNLHNTRFMPRPIAELLLQTDVRELHISLTQGLWRYETWGYPVLDAAPGAEAWAWFNSNNASTAQIDEQWKHLTSTFSGILCASLNFIDTSNTLTPRYTLHPQFASNPSVLAENQVRYASLPRENVCTENLTPWKKLLPCSSREGFASLLNSGHVHNTNYHALSINMRTICESEDNCFLEFVQTANLVYDPKLLGSTGDFSLRRFFGQGLNGHCVLAKSSKIYVSLDNEAANYDITPAPVQFVKNVCGGSSTQLAVYDVQQRAAAKEDKLFNIAWVLKKKQKSVAIAVPPPIFVHRYLLGHGQERGKIVTTLTNTHYTAISLVVQENIPWFVPVYLHTLKVTVSAIKQSQGNIKLGTVLKPRILHYIPGVQRKRAYHLELGLQIPAHSSVQISIDFDYIFLKWLEYPPDANHGHYLGSAIILVQLPVARNYTALPIEGFLFADSFNVTRNYYVQQLRTEALLLSLPTPDFSMPYNVICLACTVVALAFGPIHSVATKRIVLEQIDVTFQQLPFWRRLLNKLLRRSTSAAPLVPAKNETTAEVLAEDAPTLSI